VHGAWGTGGQTSGAGQQGILHSLAGRTLLQRLPPHRTQNRSGCCGDVLLALVQQWTAMLSRLHCQGVWLDGMLQEGSMAYSACHVCCPHALPVSGHTPRPVEVVVGAIQTAEQDSSSSLAATAQPSAMHPTASSGSRNCRQQHLSRLHRQDWLCAEEPAPSPGKQLILREEVQRPGAGAGSGFSVESPREMHWPGAAARREGGAPARCSIGSAVDGGRPWCHALGTRYAATAVSTCDALSGIGSGLWM